MLLLLLLKHLLLVILCRKSHLLLHVVDRGIYEHLLLSKLLLSKLLLLELLHLEHMLLLRIRHLDVESVVLLFLLFATPLRNNSSLVLRLHMRKVSLLISSCHHGVIALLVACLVLSSSIVAKLSIAKLS